MSPSNIAQSRSDLEDHLKDHIAFLKSSADAYDAGQDGEAKRLAVSIRVLCHDTRNSHSLLGQLGMVQQSFISTAIPHDARNISTHNGLCMVAMNGAATQYIAMLDGTPYRRHVTFDDWWREIVFVDDKKIQLSRRDIVLSVADQDGGAHVDPALNEAYARLSRHNSLGWVHSDGRSEYPIRPPERAAVRQIAHELICALDGDYRKTQTTPAEGFFGGAMVFDDVPAEWLQQPSAMATPVLRVGRNDPCPCGSGKKYKKCHGTG